VLPCMKHTLAYAVAGFMVLCDAGRWGAERFVFALALLNVALDYMWGLDDYVW